MLFIKGTIFMFVLYSLYNIILCDLNQNTIIIAVKILIFN